MSGKQGSARVKDQQSRRVLDSVARQRRARKALESLEQEYISFYEFKYLNQKEQK